MWVSTAHGEDYDPDLFPGFLVRDSRAFTLSMENDIFTGEDSHYTNGFGLIFSRGLFEQFDKTNVPEWLLPVVKKTYLYDLPKRRRAVVYSIGQIMQTPENISATELQVDDLPYAGLLAGSLTLYASDTRQSDRLSLQLGIVGPASLARQSQDIVHRLTSSEIPQGWSNQLSNEPVFQLSVRRGYRLLASAPEKNSSSTPSLLPKQVLAIFVQLPRRPLYFAWAAISFPRTVLRL